MNNELKFKLLIEKYQNGQLPQDKLALMNQFYDSLAKNNLGHEGLEWSEGDKMVLKKRVLQAIQGNEKVEPGRGDRKLVVMRWFQAAAAVTLLMVFSYWILQRWAGPREPEIVTKQGKAVETDIPAGSDKAILLLADNTVIELNDNGQQVIPKQGAVSVTNAKGTLAYNEEAGSSQLIYNTIVTPRGGQYKLTLADGSQVWLNAASSLRYPTSFTGTERVVELTGEAYFEIVTLRQGQAGSGNKIPFKVRMPSGAEVEVLGTNFNVMAYAEEEVIKTTLLEGSVKITKRDFSRVLLPNQQAQLSDQSGFTIIEDYPVEEAVAWKNNKFIFKNTGLPEIMRQLSRWYDVDVTYEKDMSGLRFGGTLSRKENVSALLNLLKLTGSVDFTVEGRKIMVTSTDKRKQD
jgi:transmembrane sensor